MSLSVTRLIPSLCAISADGSPLDLTLRAAPISIKSSAGVGAVTVHGAGVPIRTLLRSIKLLDAARERRTLRIRLTAYGTVKCALLPVITLLSGVANAVLAHFLFTNHGAAISKLWPTGAKAELRADSGIRRAILSRITVTL